MHVYSTPEFKEQVKKHEQLVFKVKRLSRELEMMAANAVQTRFERLYPYLKRKEGNFRLIARIYQVGQEQVLCWLIVFARGDREYNIFLRDREDYLDRHLKPDVFKNLSQWLKNRQIKHQQRLQKNSIPLPLPKRLRIWLQRPSWEMDLDRSIIYECNTWVTNFRQPAIRSQARAYHEIIEQLINYFGKLGRSTKWSPIKLYGDGKRYLLYSPITTIDDPPRQILLLIAPFSHLPSDRDLDKI